MSLVVTTRPSRSARTGGSLLVGDATVKFRIDAVAPGVEVVSTGDNSVCTTGGSAATTVLGSESWAALRTPMTLASKAFKSWLSTVRLLGVAPIVCKSDETKLLKR